MKILIPDGVIERKIFLIRNKRVMLDRDLAELYGVETKHLNRQVRRNIQRFPEEFCFRLNVREKIELVTICHRFKTMKYSTSLPHVFTEHGVAMLANVLNSERAIKISIVIIKTFVKLREIAYTHKELLLRLQALEVKYANHDNKIIEIFKSIQQLLQQPKDTRVIAGFRTKK
ncbi:MAG: ORF6N domain-containing protein [Candidatus Omnitrophica bacterium]|nr:ORF6N domain-containing protein [Candidatus Omnitrophota bacterium]